MTSPTHPASPLLRQCPRSLAASAYYDPQWYQQEHHTIWCNNWVYVGRLADMPHNTMKRVVVAQHPLILCRGKGDQVSAFHNTCRHRGSELCQKDEQKIGKLITCPYHAWAYAADDGRLVSVGHATPTDDFDKKAHGLFPVASKLWNGLIFLCLSESPPEFKPDLGTSALDNWPMSNLKTGHTYTKEIACNWKVFWENYNECLHCPGIHPELTDLVPIYRQGIMSEQEARGWSPEAAPGQNLKRGAKSWTLSGAPCGPEFPDLTDGERETAYTFVTHTPSVYIVAHVDYVRIVRIEPTGPETTRLTAQWLFSQETLDQPGFDAQAVAAFAKIVLDQDSVASEMNQRGLKSPKFRQGTLMPQEFDVHNFQNWVLREMGKRPQQP